MADCMVAAAHRTAPKVAGARMLMAMLADALVDCEARAHATLEVFALLPVRVGVLQPTQHA